MSDLFVETISPLLEIARFERDLVVKAGAGTGKTHALVTLYLHLLSGLTRGGSETPPARILVVTFTEKAAHELRERISARVNRLAAKKRFDLREEETLKTLSVELEKKPKPELFRQAIDQLDLAPIGTFHSICASLLRRYARQAALDPDFHLLDEVESYALKEESAAGVVLAQLEGGDEAVAELVAEYGFRPQGRGEGLVGLLMRLSNARAEEGTYLQPLSHEYDATKLDAALELAWAEFWREVSALAALSDQFKAKSAERIFALHAMVAVGKAAAEDARVAASRDILEELKTTRGGPDGVLPAAKERIRSLADALADLRLTARATPLVEALARLVLQCERAYEAKKRNIAALDFADLILRARNLLADHPAVCEEVSERYDAILVDEFQDTNRVQADVITLLAGDKAREHGRLFIVGDPKQSIYEFRGADVAVFEEVRRDIVARGGRELFLRQSRRSLPAVIASENALFAMIGAGATADAWAFRFVAGHDDLVPFREDIPKRPAGCELISVVGADADEKRQAEAKAVTGRILQLLQAGYRANDIAILFRQFTHLADYTDALKLAGVPFYVVNGRGFFDSSEVRDLAMALAAATDGNDTLSLVAFLRSPLCGVSDAAIAALSLAGALSRAQLFGAAEWTASENLPADDARALAQTRAWLRPLLPRMERMGAEKTLAAIVQHSDLLATLASRPEAQQRVANVQRLIERARAADLRGGELHSFAAWLKRIVDRGQAADATLAPLSDERDDVVRIMTVHQSKGLEFNVVFVAGAGGSEQPDRSAVLYERGRGLGLKLADLETGERGHTVPSRAIADLRSRRRWAESMRLFYVAATRAKDLIIFSGEARNRQTWRTLLDTFVAQSTSLLTAIDGATLPFHRRSLDQLDFLPIEQNLASDHLRRVTELPVPAVSTIATAVTQLEDFELCPRRYHHFHTLGLAEARPTWRISKRDTDDERELDPLRRGTLAHHLLERSDPKTRGADLEMLVEREGYTPTDEDVVAIIANVRRFLTSAWAERLAHTPSRRELPFLLSLPFAERGAHLLLRGQIDLVVFEPSGITVIDYKYARASDVEGYRFQLECYALAVRNLYPQAPRINAGLVFLRDDDPAPRILTFDSSVLVATRLVQVGRNLSLARAANEYPGREESYCREIGCGYVNLCHPTAS